VLRGWLKLWGFPLWEDEYRWHDARRYRFDVAWPEWLMAVEVDGGIWVSGGGGHNRGAAYERDRRRDLLAASVGWSVVRVTPGMLKRGGCVGLVASALRCRGWKGEVGLTGLDSV
jgi:hypothetical protein